MTQNDFSMCVLTRKYVTPVCRHDLLEVLWGLSGFDLFHTPHGSSALMKEDIHREQ